MAATPTEPSHDPVFTALDWNAKVREAYGPEWNKPEPAYEFSGGRKFELRTRDSAIYASSPDFNATDVYVDAEYVDPDYVE